MTQPSPDRLRTLVLDYLCHNRYTKTAQTFFKESAVRHLDRDGNEIFSEPGQLGVSSSELSDDVIRNIALRECIRRHILSGRVEEAILCLNEHFPRVLDESLEDEANKSFANDTSADHLEYRTTTVNPVHLSLNLRILAFIEACRTLPLSYPAQSCDSMAVQPPPASSSTCDSADEERHQTELLIRVHKLHARVNSLRKPTDRSIYQEELTNVGGLLLYKVPENSPVVKYLSQERRERVAEQVDCAILYDMSMPVISSVELAVRYTHCLWSTLHTMRTRLPPRSRWPAGVSLPPILDDQTSVSSEKESLEIPPFDLQRFLSTKT